MLVARSRRPILVTRGSLDALKRGPPVLSFIASKSASIWAALGTIVRELQDRGRLAVSTDDGVVIQHRNHDLPA